MISFVIILGLTSLPEPEVGLINFDEMIEEFTKTYNYVEENTSRPVTEREYYAVMRLASSDPDKAIEIFNDPDYPHKFYDETGYLPDEKTPEMYPIILKSSIDNFSYIKENTNRKFTSDEYSSVMRLSNADPIKAVEIFNDPGYPEKFYDENGLLP